MYDKPLVRKPDGSFERWLGIGGTGTKQVFRMPAEISQDEAENRWRQIVALWQQVEASFSRPDSLNQSFDAMWGPRYWDDERLALAKAISKGEPPLLDRPLFDSPFDYAQRLAKTQKQLGTRVIPADNQMYEKGLDTLKQVIAVTNEQVGTLTNKPGIQITGISLGQALEAYKEDIDKNPKYRTHEGKRKSWGKTQLDSLKSLTSFYLASHLKLDLGELNASRCTEIIELFASRPLTQRGTAMTKKSASNMVKLIRRFFRWLDLEDRFPWDLPKKFDLRAKIEYRKRDPLHEPSVRLENIVISLDELKVIAEYGTPLERLYFFLALNCAYGADQLGRLRSEWLDLDAGRIDGERFKAESLSRHHLWPICVDGLKWYLSQTPRTGIVFISESTGDPVYHESMNGNVIDGFASRWNDLMKRIRKDKVKDEVKDKGKFRFSFGKIRKTAATMTLRIADPHIASMLLAHKTIAEDELLKHYVNLPWDKLYEAQQKLQEELAPVFAAAGPEPFADKPKDYIGLEPSKKILELFTEGLSTLQIAEQVGVSTATVSRHLQRKHGKRKPGRRPKPK